MGGVAAVAKQYFDRIFTADAHVADGHKVIAQRMQAQVEDRNKIFVFANFAAMDLVKSGPVGVFLQRR